MSILADTGLLSISLSGDTESLASELLSAQASVVAVDGLPNNAAIGAGGCGFLGFSNGCHLYADSHYRLYASCPSLPF